MKPRIKIDSAILSSVIILTAFVCGAGHWYADNHFLDNLLDFLGMMLILKGTYIRMAARGHKKAYSKKGEDLVVTGLYSLTRNPMYLGSFFIGCGFVLILWPWWALPVFFGLFYLRFRRQIAKEEEHLRKLFGKKFEAYCKQVPPVFPAFKELRAIKINQVMPRSEVWSTQEKRGIFIWPAAAVILEMIKDKIFFRSADVSEILFIFLLAVVFFSVGLWWEYSRV